MEELLKWISDNGFQIDGVQADGNIYRFDRDGKKNAWIWAAQIYTTKTGEPYIIAQVGDWKTEEEFSFRPNKAFSREDKKIIQSKIKDLIDKAAKAKQALHQDAREIAGQIFAGSRIDKLTEYMARKKIPDFYGAKVTKQSSIDYLTGRKGKGGHDPDVLIIPMRSNGGTLWGLQQITDHSYKGNNKYFLTGQRIEGCYHLIPEDADLNGPDPIYICEGFSTGVAIHLATQGTVAIALTANNVLSVAKAIRADHADKPMIICGDDDQWNRRPDGSPYNIGKEKSEEAAKAVMGKLIFPKFRSDEGKPTDFNDLYVIEGLEVVKKQILEIKAERHYVRCLGHREGFCYYTSSDNKEIVCIGEHNEDKLTYLMRRAYWETLYPSKTGVDWKKAADELKQKCRERGIFYGSDVRGLGVWDDEGRTVVHLGDRLSVNGEEVGIHDISSRYIYLLDKRARSIHPKPLTKEECKPILNLMDLLAFQRRDQRYFLGGWIMAAKLSGLLDWRPQIWVNGESGSGKSTVMTQFVLPMLGEQIMRFTGGSTEPGMRHDVKSHAIPILYDEFEPDGQESIARVKACIEFIRQASTDAGNIAKGSIGGKSGSIKYKARFCAAVSSIRTLLNNQADRSRFTLIEFEKIHNNPGQWAKVEKALKAFTPEYADRYFARLLKFLPVIKANMRKFEDAFALRHSQRVGQQYGPLMAGWCILMMDTELESAEIRAMVDSVELDLEPAASDDTDQHDCLNHLLHRKISIIVNDARSDVTVSRAIEEARHNEKWNEELCAYGIRFVRSVNIPSGEGIFIASKNPQLSVLFRDTSWQSGWVGSISRLPNAKRNAVASLSGIKVKGVIVDISTLTGAQIQDKLTLELPAISNISPSYQ